MLAQAQDADVQKGLPEAFLQVAAAATLSAADHGLHGKEQATRRSRTLPNDAQMFADGFAVGLSFALQVSHPLCITNLQQTGNLTCCVLTHASQHCYIDRPVLQLPAVILTAEGHTAQALGQQEHFDNLQWWRALGKYHDQQQRNLRGCTGTKTQVSSTGAVSGTWLQGLFKFGKDAGAHQHVNTDMFSEVDMGRMQLQLQHLERMQQEIKLIQRTFEAVSSVWTRI